MNIQELIDRYSTGERDFSSIQALKHFKVPRGQNLSGIILRECNLNEVDFSEAILVDADLSGITCSHVSFRNANLRSANISAATFLDMPGSPILKDELNTTSEILVQICPEDIEIIKKDYLRFGDPLGAIKFLRGQTGWDLPQAKSAIDSVVAQ